MGETPTSPGGTNSNITPPATIESLISVVADPDSEAETYVNQG
jgi:hypothetical protein